MLVREKIVKEEFQDKIEKKKNQASKPTGSLETI